MIARLALVALLLALPALAEEPAPPQDPELTAALLAIEEAELRERMITALAIAEGVRLRGRTILVAISELDRVQRALTQLSPTDPARAALEARVARLEGRRAEISGVVDREFDSYVAVVTEIAGELWPRLRRVGRQLEEDLEGRRLDRLGALLPLLRAHVGELNRTGGLPAEALGRWRTEIDDSYALRKRRLDERLAPEPEIAPKAGDTERDI